MTCPVTSDGIRSGVNCTRRKSRSSAWASVLTSSVLATPGTPSSSTWPRTSSAATSPETAPSCPTTALAISLRTRSTASLADTGDLPADGVDGLAAGDELGLVAGDGGLQGAQHPLAGDAGAGGGVGDLVGRGGR